LGEPLYVLPTSDRASRVDFSKRILDPACGSGTFLILAIRAIKEHARRAGLSEAETLEVILNGVVGIDLNPLAVLAARVGYLLAIADLVPFRRGPIAIPVYLADSVLEPREGVTLFDERHRSLTTVVGQFPVPGAIKTGRDLSLLTDVLDEYVSSGFAIEAFVERVRRDLSERLDAQDEATLARLFTSISDLHRAGLDGIWARIVKNAFMPLFIGQFDYVAGNPPWVNWESLPEGYRRETEPLWLRYNLVLSKGMKAAFTKDDLAVLMTYAVIDRFLKEHGRLAFVITQTVFKTELGGRGFRQFRIPPDIALRVLHVDDMTELSPFEGASNRTAVLVLRRNDQTRYPVAYTYWKKATKGRAIGYDSTLEDVQNVVRRFEWQATPVQDLDPLSPWLTARPGALRALKAVLGASQYQAREGLNTGGANGVFWIRPLTIRPDGLVVVRNVTERARREVDQVEAELEPALVYPLLRGREMGRWRAQPELSVLVTHLPGSRLNAIPVKVMQSAYPNAFRYLARFEDALRQRGGWEVRNLMKTGPFYSMSEIGDYTFAPFKLVWREQGSNLDCAVVGSHEGKLVIPDHKLMMVPFEHEDEALYTCAVLNSSPAQLAAAAYVISIQQGTHILRYINVPLFDRTNPVHSQLSMLARHAHGGETEEALAPELDSATAQLWGIEPREMQEIRRNLSEINA